MKGRKKESKKEKGRKSTKRTRYWKENARMAIKQYKKRRIDIENKNKASKKENKKEKTKGKKEDRERK